MVLNSLCELVLIQFDFDFGIPPWPALRRPEKHQPCPAQKQFELQFAAHVIPSQQKTPTASQASGS